MEDPQPIGVVAAGTQEAAQAGAAILNRGGNAVDAAVAVSLVLGVTEPAGSGIGGQATFIVQKPGEEPFVINGTSFAPREFPADTDGADLVGHRATTVPSCLRVLDFAWRRFGSGTVAWADLVKPAIGCAHDGFPLGAFRHRALLRHAEAIRRNGAATQLFLAPDGSIPEQGSSIRQPVLGRTLEQIARAGATDFYKGEVARGIAEDMATSEGWITLQDLESVPEPEILAPLKTTYRGWDVCTLPPPGAGWVVMLALNILERAPAGVLAVESSSRLIWLAEALRIAHRQRARRAFANAATSAAALTGELDKNKARKLIRHSMRSGVGETTHFSVVDALGTMVGVTQSLNSYYGSKAASRKLGFLYNDYMRELIVGVEGHPFALRPHAAPLSFMSATILSRDRRPALVLGSPGDDRIISAVVQVISRWVDVAQSVGEAVAAPRVHTLRGETVLLETRPREQRALIGLERRGYTVYQPLTSLFAGELNPYFGGVHAVALEEGGWSGAADPRRDGAVVTARRGADHAETDPASH
jgi:gamma-glutamyltranspeptidase/glutathione hydrolase